MNAIAPSNSALRDRVDTALPERLSRSANATTGRISTDELRTWFSSRRHAHRFQVERIPFSALQGWDFVGTAGNLRHHSGRFFTVEGLHAYVDDDLEGREWWQPIIRQPEVGILGLLAKEFYGVLHLLVQAKMEPGNPGMLQLSPTVQATHSNYTAIHQGGNVPYLEYFTNPERRRVVVDVLQSEHGSWFYRKSNRNMLVETTEDVPVYEDFCWLTLGQLHECLHEDHYVNMDARTVLSCLPPYRRDDASAHHTDAEVLSWFTEIRSGKHVRAEPVALTDLPGWVQDDWAIAHVEGRHFRVVGVSVQAQNREVGSWTQPLFAPNGMGLVCFLLRRFDGAPHVLVHARAEAGFLDTVELAPSVQCIPEDHAHRPVGQRPPFLGVATNAPASSVWYDALHSEEGGRFLEASNRYLVVEPDPAQSPDDPPPDYCWVTPGQLVSLLRHGHYVNVQARTLLACLRATGAV